MWTLMIILLFPAIYNTQAHITQFDLDDFYFYKNIPEDWKIPDPSTVKSINVTKVNVTAIKEKAFKEFMNLESLTLSGRIDKIEDNAFDGLFHIKEILLNENGIQNIGLTAFNNLFHLITLYLNKNEIKKVRFSNLLLLEKLYLSGNSLTELDQNNFINLPKLQTINLSNNLIHKITTGTFDSCPNLINLYLGNNKLKIIEPDLLYNLKKLEFLNINDNYITNITAANFVALIKLNILDLRHNKIAHIDNIAFNGLINLSQLYLSFNHISSLYENLFVNLYKLSEVRFDHNLLRSLQYNLFENTPNLRSVDFSYNLLKSFQISNNVINLTNVNLEHNEIESVKWWNIIQASNIKRLNLAENKLTYLDESFNKLVYLVELSLKNNKIKNFSMCVSPYLTHLDLSQNEIYEISLDTFCYYDKLFTTGVLSEVYLSSNNFTSFNISFMRNSSFQTQETQPHLKLIDLRNNSLNADDVKQINDFTEGFDKPIILIDAQPEMKENNRSMKMQNGSTDFQNKNNPNNKLFIVWIVVGSSALLIITFAVIFGVVMCRKRRSTKPHEIARSHEVFKPTTTTENNYEEIPPDLPGPYEVYEFNTCYESQEQPSHYEIVE